MTLVDEYLAAIHAAYPDVTVGSASLNRQGQNADILVVNDKLVFRFPRYAGGVHQVQTEVAILRGVAGRLPLPVPEPRYVHLSEQPPGAAFVGYAMLPGQSLWREALADVGAQATVDRWAEELGAFLRALHGVPFASAIACELEREETLAEMRSFYRCIRRELFERMRPRARARVERLFTAYLADAGHFDYQPALRHGDFGSSNILYDPQTLSLTGVIDFGSAAVGDPAYDVAGLIVSYGERFVRRCAVTYPEIEGFWERADFYRQTFALEEALFGIEYDDAAAFRAGMEEFI